MILNFRRKGIKKLYEQAVSKGLSADRVPKIERILARLDVAAEPEVMNLPGLRLHPLKGELKVSGLCGSRATGGLYSVSIEAVYVMLIWWITIDPQEVVT